MAYSTPQANNVLIKFKADVTRGFVRDHRYGRYIGSGMNAIIRRIRDISSKGKQINIPLIDAMTGRGLGSGTLVGNEKKLDDYGMPMWADFNREAIAWQKPSEIEATYSINTEATEQLRMFAKRVMKEEITEALLSIPTATIQTGYGGELGSRINGVKWASATATQKNNWSDDNSDRVIYGKLLSNRVAGNAASSLANIDATDDRLTTALVELAKRTAMSTTANKITPYQIEADGQEIYVLMVGTRAMRDLKASMLTSLQNSVPREGQKFPDNPLFRSGDIMWDNVIITEIPEIDELLTLTGAGAGGTVNVVPCFLLGASALGYVMGQDPTPTRRDETDYGFLTGIGIEARYGIGKIGKIPVGGTRLKDWGMVTVFVASVPDA